jgi:hypothetical protein
MKSLITLILFASSLICYSQKAIIKLKNKDVLKITITAHSNADIIRPEGNILFADMDTVIFESLRPFQEELRVALVNAQVVVIVSPSEYNEVTPVVLKKNSKIVQIENNHGTAQFQKVIEVDTSSAATLYKIVYRWVRETFNSPDAVISNTFENEEVRGNGFDPSGVQLSIFPPLYGSLKYSFKVDIKPGKVRFTLYNMVGIFKNGTYPLEVYLLKSNGQFKTNYEAVNVTNSTSSVANSLILSLESALRNKGKKSEDW